MLFEPGLNWKEFALLARFGEVLLAPAREELILSKNLPLWDRYTERQDYPGSAHHATRAIHLRGPKEWTQEGVQQSLASIQYVVEQRCLPHTTNLMLSILTLVGAKQFGRAMVVALKPLSHIDEHIDEGLYAEHFQRVHLVLSTETGKDYFFCGDEVRSFAEGELWWFNHHKPHSASNSSATQPRVHLIVDFRV